MRKTSLKSELERLESAVKLNHNDVLETNIIPIIRLLVKKVIALEQAPARVA